MPLRGIWVTATPGLRVGGRLLKAGNPRIPWTQLARGQLHALLPPQPMMAPGTACRISSGRWCQRCGQSWHSVGLDAAPQLTRTSGRTCWARRLLHCQCKFSDKAARCRMRWCMVLTCNLELSCCTQQHRSRAPQAMDFLSIHRLQERCHLNASWLALKARTMPVLSFTGV